MAEDHSIKVLMLAFLYPDVVQTLPDFNGKAGPIVRTSIGDSGTHLIGTFGMTTGKSGESWHTF
ncbi:hypothetical protein BOTNAR_0222g00090 [Botryotinia narcissicola]|uniref:Uncharacterized protein n=1 Tax=Botryotinia narcissicola TaxID=278944 RepID=A0A4Z1I4E5_9HELO|nr:hypothetical protein BOTNAR_0222g00090 [Botryotinia narcissicola]